MQSKIIYLFVLKEEEDARDEVVEYIVKRANNKSSNSKKSMRATTSKRVSKTITKAPLAIRPVLK